MKKIRTYGLVLLLAAVLYALIQGLITLDIINPYYAQILIPIGINIMLAVTLNLVCGYLGQLALGHAGFMSVGAYASAIFTLQAPFPAGCPGWAQLLAAMLVGGAVAAILGVLIGVPALRVRGDYLAIMTLGFGEIIRVILNNMKAAGGGMTLSAPKLTSFTMVFWTVTVIVAVVYTFIHSRHGRAVISIREDEVSAESSGINTTYYKVLAFTLAAALAGVAGALWSHQYSIRPGNFDFNKSIDILIFVVLGGMGSITGSVLAATVLTILPEMLRDFADYRMIVYALLLIIMMVFRPSGLLGRYEFSLTRAAGKAVAFLRGRRGAAKEEK